MITEQINKIRFNKLTKQRILEIMREGVPLTFIQINYPAGFYYIYQTNHSAKLNQMLKQDKYALQICSKNGVPLVKLQTSSFYTQQHAINKLCINHDIRFPSIKFYHGENYYIAKYNPTNKIHKSIYSQNGLYYKCHDEIPSKHIVDYIEGVNQDIIHTSPMQFSYQTDLNLKQNQAIYKAGLYSITFIKGPPGCGKTKTIGRLCRLFLQQQKPVLVGCVSNIGILSITKQIIQQISYYNDHQRILQLTQHMRLQSQGLQTYFASQQFTMISQLKFIYFTSLLSLADYNKLEPLLRFYSINAYLIRNIVLISRDFISIKQIVYKLQQLKNKIDVGKKFMCIYMLAFAKTIKEAHLIITTTVTAASINERIKPQDYFRPFVAILDQASQASFADTLCYLKFDVEKLVLVGDQNQLDPTVISNDKVLKETVFNNMSLQNLQYFSMLNIQYRMHPQIAQIPNLIFYNNQIQDGVTSQERQSNIQYFKNHPISFINHSYQQIQYIQSNDLGKKKNYYNIYQIIMIKQKLQLFKKQDLQHVGIITPYGAQLHFISLIFHEQIVNYGLTVKTCDGYQGGQKDYIFVSCVRSNQVGKIGFCGERNRVNVTISRAKRGLLIIGNAVTLSAEETIWKDIIEMLRVRGKCLQYGRQINQFQIHQLQLLNNSKYIANCEQQNNFNIQNPNANNNVNNESQISIIIQKQTIDKQNLIKQQQNIEKIIINNQKQIKNNNNNNNKQLFNNRLMAKLIQLKTYLQYNPKQQSQDLLQFNKDIIKKIRKTLSNNLKKGKRYNQAQFYTQLNQQLSATLQTTPINSRINNQAIESLLHLLQSQSKEINLKQKIIQQLSIFNPINYQYNHLLEASTIKKIVELYLLSKITG